MTAFPTKTKPNNDEKTLLAANIIKNNVLICKLDRFLLNE